MSAVSNDKWFHAHITRERAEYLVQNARVDGSFVVRPSESVNGAYALSLLYRGSIHTYRILPTPSGSLAVQTADGVQKKKFSSIDDLVTDYRRSNNGLACGLTNPVSAISVPVLPHRNVMPSAPPLTDVLIRPPGFTGPVNLPPRVPQPAPQPQVVEDRTCVICLDKPKDAHFQPCGHLCCCMECAGQINDCPICRKKIASKSKAYF